MDDGAAAGPRAHDRAVAPFEFGTGGRYLCPAFRDDGRRLGLRWMQLFGFFNAGDVVKGPSTSN